MTPRIKKLKVSTPKGESITAVIKADKDVFTLSVNYLEAVEKDNPKFADKGVIRVSGPRTKYSNIIKAIEKYLEDLFLKELSNEDTSTSDGSGLDKRATHEIASSGKDKSTKRKGNSSSVRDSARGDESPEKSKNEDVRNTSMAEENDSADKE